MPVSIEELDATVRAFYEGRGEQVGIDRDSRHVRIVPLTTAVSGTAKSCPSRLEPGMSTIIAQSDSRVLLLTECCSSRKTPMLG